MCAKRIAICSLVAIALFIWVFWPLFRIPRERGYRPFLLDPWRFSPNFSWCRSWTQLSPEWYLLWNLSSMILIKWSGDRQKRKNSSSSYTDAQLYRHMRYILMGWGMVLTGLADDFLDFSICNFSVHLTKLIFLWDIY